MKMVKKFLFGLAAVATILAFVSCDGLLDKKNTIGGVEEDDDVAVEGAVNGKIITGQASNAKIDVTNNSETEYIREVDLLLTNHYGSRAVIVQEDIDEAKAKGMMGYAFNVVVNEDKTAGTKTYDLSVVGATMYKGVPVTYISVFRNVANLNESNLGAAKGHVYSVDKYADFLKDTEPCECEIVALPVKDGKATKNLEKYAYDETAKTFTVAINVTAEDDGSYSIDYYDPKDVLKDNGSWISSLKLKNVTAKETEKIPATVTGYTTKTQAKLGVYANVYGASSLKGSWRLSGIKGEGEVEAFED